MSKEIDKTKIYTQLEKTLYSTPFSEKCIA